VTQKLRGPDFGSEMCDEQHEVTPVLNPSNVELNPICPLLALLGAHHILHVSRIELNPICHLLALLGAHHILHVVNRIRV